MKTLNEWMADMESKYAVPGCEDTRAALKIIRELNVNLPVTVKIVGERIINESGEPK